VCEKFTVFVCLLQTAYTCTAFVIYRHYLLNMSSARQRHQQLSQNARCSQFQKC